ncbi:MAG: pantoate--beta-alanine ligase [Candidatus Eremiobacteraeota bacterium]|nr:pantoate--beta-alanine ligase [Candidatus Eremiobacteraeota bacterium]
MEVVAAADAARRAAARLPRPLAFVPTMGALHEGHLELVRRARAECRSVLASIFVNPLQFGAGEDLERYPRDFDRDRRLLAECGADVLFAPPVDVMYPAGFAVRIDVGELGTRYEGSVRPTHFSGVATVVAKLLGIVSPDSLYLGQKDAQQTAVLRTLVRDLEFATDVRIVPTVRETDGLAMSSRNVYLTPEQRAEAPSLFRALQTLVDAMHSGTSKEAALEKSRAMLGASATWDYLDVVDADTFVPIDRLRAPAFAIGAARFGTTRLLDNVWIAS